MSESERNAPARGDASPDKRKLWSTLEIIIGEMRDCEFKLGGHGDVHVAGGSASLGSRSSGQ